jgi:hypothetical protein
MKPSKKAQIASLNAHIATLSAQNLAFHAQLTQVRKWRYNWLEPADTPKLRAHVRRLDEILYPSAPLNVVLTQSS